MERTRWYKNAIVYQIYPFSFMDSNDDGIGDINGIINRLDYLKTLGITAIWFSPLYDSPNKDYGYDIKDYYKIAPHFGTNEDFVNLINECHNRDIKVIMDMVINHTSTEHEWFKRGVINKEIEYRDYYIIRKGRKIGKKLLPPNNWTSSFIGSVWENIEGTDEFYLHLFTKDQPDLNWENEKVREEITNIINYYLNLGVDGFRFDVFNMYSKNQKFKNDLNIFHLQKGTKWFVDGERMHEFLKELNNKSFVNFDSFTVGEAFSPNLENSIDYIKEENEEFDSIFNFEHFKSDRFLGLSYLKRKFSLKRFKNGLFKVQDLYFNNNSWNTLVLENHDNPRCVSRFNIDYKNYWYEASTFLPLITYFMWGTPFIYQGQEIGTIDTPFVSIDEMKDPVSHYYYNLLKRFHLSDKKAFKIIKNGARDHARTPMQWDNSITCGFSNVKPWMMSNPTHLIVNLVDDLNDKRSVFKFYQKVIILKKNIDCLIYGSIKEYDHKNKNIIAYKRSLNDDNFFIFGNFSNKTVNYKLPKEIDIKNANIILSNYDNLELKEVMELKPYEAYLIKM